MMSFDIEPDRRDVPAHAASVRAERFAMGLSLFGMATTSLGLLLIGVAALQLAA